MHTGHSFRCRAIRTIRNRPKRDERIGARRDPLLSRDSRGSPPQFYSPSLVSPTRSSSLGPWSLLTSEASYLHLDLRMSYKRPHSNSMWNALYWLYTCSAPGVFNESVMSDGSFR